MGFNVPKVDMGPQSLSTLSEEARGLIHCIRGIILLQISPTSVHQYPSVSFFCYFNNLLDPPATDSFARHASVQENVSQSLSMYL